MINLPLLKKFNMQKEILWNKREWKYLKKESSSKMTNSEVIFYQECLKCFPKWITKSFISFSMLLFLENFFHLFRLVSQSHFIIFFKSRENRFSNVRKINQEFPETMKSFQKNLFYFNYISGKNYWFKWFF
jgi:hypothetical protein